ncbi:MAG: ribosome biogenesis GTPase YlqF [Aphanocapsa feldmannii 277cV]|uniref:Ribosome biogenesis GTPase A n=2 Tax=Aphanocapsa feldmannii TaxID=192050 RepID=A0A524RNG1_9CHRO|nr:MAG: ribosome biogenesis GTPase YlqF [Aphanocapsa feldmannii 277cV]TGH20000.1 MAG: ribosome biogenesis GTPase YlqF [Aphanocapsa feldmannii 277cI]
MARQRCPVPGVADQAAEPAPPETGQRPTIQWYPGHIAKAEQALTSQLAKVDLVLEVRDARIPLATGHPHLARWTRGKRHLLVINRRDMVSRVARTHWDQWFRRQGQQPLWCDARAGSGTGALIQAALRSCEAINARRLRRSMRPRPVRALMLGFPNVGKSALINRLVGRRVVASARRAGVTRNLRWVRLGQALDLLDAPGVLPPRLEDQRAATLLAICDDIGEAAYGGEAVARALLERLVGLQVPWCEQPMVAVLGDRYGVSPEGDSHGWLQAAADRHTSGDGERMAQRLLDDFRKGLLGSAGLEHPPGRESNPP